MGDEAPTPTEGTEVAPVAGPDTGTPPSSTSTTGPPTPTELARMKAVMRRLHRKNQAETDKYITEALRARDKDDWRFIKFKGDVLYSRDIDRLEGRSRPSTATRRAQAALNKHVDFMNEAYNVGLEYPEFIEIGDPIAGSAPSVFDLPTDRSPRRVMGAGRLMRPGEEF